MPTAWRLVGSNNRELGRSAHVYPDLAACKAAVMFLQAHLDEAESLLATNNDTGLWLWRLNIGDQWMAAAGRSYQRRRECLYNVLRFVAAAPIAVLSSDVLGRSRGHDLHRADTRVAGDAGGTYRPDGTTLGPADPYVDAYPEPVDAYANGYPQSNAMRVLIRSR